MMETIKLKNILEALLLTTDRPLTVAQLENLLSLDEEQPSRDDIRKALHDLDEDYSEKCMELKQVASGFRIQVKQDYTSWVSRLWEEKPARYSRATLETLSLIAYRQPITRGEIEEVRGVSVSSSIIKTCIEREWIRVLGHKDVPGKPALYGTTKEFLDYFNLKSLDQLPTLAEIKDLDKIHPELALDDETEDSAAATEDGEVDAAANDIENLADSDAEQRDAEDDSHHDAPEAAVAAESDEQPVLTAALAETGMLADAEQDEEPEVSIPLQASAAVIH